MVGAKLSNKNIWFSLRSWGAIVLTLLMTLIPAAPAVAVCTLGQQACSSNYSVGESFFGNGGNLDQSSASYRAKTSLGETAIGNSAGNYAAVITGDSPVGYWRLGESSGTTAVDSSGNSRNGTYSGGFKLGLPGLNGGADTATSFDGVTNSHVAIAGNAAFKIDTTNQLAVELWYAGTQPGTGSTAGSETGLFSSNANSTNKQWVIGLDGSGHAVLNSVQSGGGYNSLIGNTVITDGKPHYIEANFDRTAATMELYIDGTLDNSNSVSSIGSFNAPTVEIGENPRGAAASGKFDEAAIYSSKLSATQIAKHYAAGTYQIQAGFDSDRTEYLQALVSTSSIDFGTLTNSSTHVGTAAFSVKAYLANGYQVVSSSTPPKNGSYTMAAPSTPTASTVGTEQFGINVVGNTCPGTAPGSGPGSCTSTLGSDPAQIPSNSFSYGQAGNGTGNTPSTASYDQTNKYMYRDGDVIAYSTKSSGETDYTISYIMNISSVTPGGTYSMVQSLVATATF